jgi:hypothetical protein
MKPSTASTTSFLHFVEAMLGIKLSPGQRILWAVLSGAAQPESFEGEDREIARQLFGDVDRIPRKLLSTVSLVKGRRIGATRVIAARLIYLGLTSKLTTAPGEVAAGMLVGPDLRVAQNVLNFITGMIDSSPALQHREVKRTETSVFMLRDDGRQITFECLPASRGGSAVRGRTLFGLIMDEGAFFGSEENAVSDAEVFRAAVAGLIPGGQAFVSSTPYTEAGLLFDLHEANFGHPVTGVSVAAPTRLMRTDDPEILEMVERETLRDPVTAAREYEAVFLSRGSSLFFDSAAIEAAIDYALVLPLAARGRMAAGVDPGFTKDCAAFVAVGDHDGVITVHVLDELQPAKGSPLAPSFVFDRWAALAKSLGISSLRTDTFYRESLREVCDAHKLTLDDVPGGQNGKRRMYERLRALLAEGKVRLPNHPRLIEQLRKVMQKPTPGGGLSITSPRSKRGGDHGDLVSALVAAVWAIDEGSSVAMWLAAMDQANF